MTRWGKAPRILTGGKAPDGQGFFYPATVLTDVPDDAKLLREEIFGPVAPLQRFKSEEEAIHKANDTEYGLVAYLYTRDLERGMKRLGETGIRHGGAQPRACLRPGRAVRRHEAKRHRPRGRP